MLQQVGNSLFKKNVKKNIDRLMWLYVLLSVTMKRPKGKVAYVLQVKTTKIMKVLAKAIDLCHIGILGPIYLYLKLLRKC